MTEVTKMLHLPTWGLRKFPIKLYPTTTAVWSILEYFYILIALAACAVNYFRYRNFVAVL